MKAELIQPGSIVAMRMFGATTQTIRDGTRAVPGVVLGVGKYRKQNQRWCGNISVIEVEPDHQSLANTYVAVMRPEVSAYATHNPGPVKIEPTTEWKLDLVQPGQCYPWDVFALAHQDYQMAVAERNAWGERATVIRKEMEALVHQSLSELIAKGIIVPSRLSLDWRWKYDPKPNELEAKLHFECPESPKNTSDILRFESPRTLLADWLMEQCPQLVEEHERLMDKIQRCRL